jgi:hypothetical protein
MAEVADFEIDCYQPFEFTVVEEQIDVKIIIVNLETFLTGDEGKACAHFEQKFLDVSQDGIFEILFEIAIV